jgi:hypothetical protein
MSEHNFSDAVERAFALRRAGFDFNGGNHA